MEVGQALFGYNDGHRLLATSTDLSSTAVSRLLGATDAAVSDPQTRLLTAFPLPEADAYALCATWAAPEISRPGAVWSHVLLLPQELVATDPHPGRWFELVLRPSDNDPRPYDLPISLPSGSVHPTRKPPEALIHAVVGAAYDERQASWVVADDLEGAEQALFALWSSQWPALRWTFSFRTRDSLRPSTAGADVVITRRLRGVAGNGTRFSEPYPPWLDAVAQDVASKRPPSQLRKFLWHFGVDEEPSPTAVSRLAQLYALVGTGDAVLTRERVEHNYPGTRSARSLKLELFGEDQSTWWNVSEEIRVLALISSSKNAWDARELAVENRAEHLVENGDAAKLATALALRAPARIRSAVINALASAGEAKDFGVVLGANRAAARDWVRRNPLILHQVSTWKDVPEKEVADLLELVSYDPEALRAALGSGNVSAAIKAAGLDRVLNAFARTRGDLKLLRQVVKMAPHDQLDLAAMTPENTLLLGAADVPVDETRLVEALEASRTDPDELWLTAAALLLSRNSTGSVLETVFGPLHHAITDDRLPHELWRSLNRILPSASDPALRLRRKLIDVARAETWSKRRLERAVRDAGPFAARLAHDLDKDDPFLGVVKAVAKAVGRLIP